MTKPIKQTIHFDVSPHEVYEALMDSKKHTSFTRASAKIDAKVGGEFSVWDGYATGKTLELIPDKKIVQTWHASDWSDKADSIIIFALKEKDGGTELQFEHQNVPAKFYEDIVQGWTDNYWDLMKDYFKK